MKININVAFVVLLFVSMSAIADCEYDGQLYPEGASIGPYICSGSQWVAK